MMLIEQQLADLKQQNGLLAAELATCDQRAIEKVQAEMARLRAENARLKELPQTLIAMVDRHWSFDNSQRHTHSWHEKQACLERMRELTQTAAGPQG